MICSLLHESGTRTGGPRWPVAIKNENKITFTHHKARIIIVFHFFLRYRQQRKMIRQTSIIITGGALLFIIREPEYTVRALIKSKVYVTGIVLDDENCVCAVFLKNNLITSRKTFVQKNSVFLSVCNMLMLQKLDIFNDS